MFYKVFNENIMITFEEEKSAMAFIPGAELWMNSFLITITENNQEKAIYRYRFSNKFNHYLALNFIKRFLIYPDFREQFFIGGYFKKNLNTLSIKDRINLSYSEKKNLKNEFLIIPKINILPLFIIEDCIPNNVKEKLKNFIDYDAACRFFIEGFSYEEILQHLELKTF
jgi:hypothetical protein